MGVIHMPIKIPSSLPAAKILEAENIFAMTEERAHSQDIRPLKLAIVNLMPKKMETETQLLRLLSNTAIQTDIELIQMSAVYSRDSQFACLDALVKEVDVYPVAHFGACPVG